MNAVILTTAMIATMLLRVCSASDEDTAPPTMAGGPQAVVVAEAELPTVTANVQAQHGGTVVVAQDHAVEIVAQPTGEVRAWVLHVEGNAPPPPETNIIVNVPGSDHVPHQVSLVWDGSAGYYQGALVDVTPVPGPMNVVVTVNGTVRRGSVAHYVVMRPARADVNVNVNAPAPPHGHVDVHINAPPPPSARVDVRVNGPFIPAPPSGHVNVQIGGPQVTVHSPSVRVQGGGSVRVHGNNGLMRGHTIGVGHGGMGGMGMH